MTDVADRLASAWSQLRRPMVSPYAAYPIGETAAGDHVRAVVDQQGRRHLLVPVEEGFSPPPDRLPLLGLSGGSFGFDGDVRACFDIECRDASYEDQFGRFCVDVVTAATGSARPGAAAVGVVEKWRRLFSSTRTGLLSERRRLALFAELSLLRSLLMMRPEMRVSCWRGPRREPHDFVLPGHAVEVKAAGVDSSQVTVHGIEQLQPPPGCRLTLAIGYVLEDPEGETLTALTDDIRSRVVRAGELDDLLADAGWTPAEPPTTYAVADWWVVPVGSGTPRLVPDSLASGRLPGGISNVRYDIELQTLRRAADGTTIEQLAREVTA